MTDARSILQQLGLTTENPGTWTGDGGWAAGSEGALLDSVNPSSGESLASVRTSDAADYERLLRSAQSAAIAWRAVPAPRRGDAIRQLCGTVA